jgi:hypothetical protein
MSYLRDIDDKTIDEMGREWVDKLNKATQQLAQHKHLVQKLELDIDTAKRLVADLRAERSRRSRDHDAAA